MQNNETSYSSGLTEEEIVRAWSTGSTEQQGRMLYRLVHEAIYAKDEVRKVKRQLHLLWGGVAVVTVVGAPILLSALSVLGD